MTAALVNVTGWRKYRLVTSVPTRMRLVSAAINVNVAGPSNIVCRGRSGSTTVSQFHKHVEPQPFGVPPPLSEHIERQVLVLVGAETQVRHQTGFRSPARS